MHLAYFVQQQLETGALHRRQFLRTMGMSALALGLSPTVVAATGFRGEGEMNTSTGEDWIDTFFTGGADAIIHYYADEFVFEDITLFQTITTKEELHAAFVPFNDAGPDSPAGVHQFDVIRYDGGKASAYKGVLRKVKPENYTEEEYQQWSQDIMLGGDFDYDEFAVMNWIWKAKHNQDFLGLPAKGKTTVTRGMTFHAYKSRKIVREFTYWNFRGVAIQLGVLEPQSLFWKKDA
jgi:steroid delta-isomerase-like uncharacterized protein